MKSISVQYQELKEGKINKNQFLRNARMMFPTFITNLNSFDDSVKILKNKGILNEGDAVKGVPDKAPTYDYPTQPGKYKKVIQEPEVDEQDGIYPATTLTDIPKEEMSKPVKSKNRPDGLEPAKDKDKKNEMKKVRLVRESKKNLVENQVTSKQIQDKYNEMFGKNPQTTFADVAKALGVSEQDIAAALFFKGNMPGLKENNELDKAKKAAEKLSKEELKALWAAWDKRGEKAFAGILPVGSQIDIKREKLKEAIKKMVYETIDELGPVAQQMAGNPEEEKASRISIIRKKRVSDEDAELEDLIKRLEDEESGKYTKNDDFEGGISEYERGDESDTPPSIPGIIGIVVDDMINRIESNDLNLEFTSKDVEDVLDNFQDKIGHRYRDEQYQDIIDGVVSILKKKGYNIK